MRSPDSTGYARAWEPRQFTFPPDHGPHPEFRTEWWYYTGNLTGDDGRPLGYQLTFFRNALSPTQVERQSTLASNQTYMAHFAISDGASQTHTSFDRYSRGAAGLAGAQGNPSYAVWLEDWSAREIEPGVVQLKASAQNQEGEFALDLTLLETRPPILHGNDGLHQKGPEPGNASYYYSLAGLQTTGTVTLPSGVINAAGASWMDHEFGTSALSDDTLGWDWFSLQLDNGAALMLYEFRTQSGAAPADVQGTLAWPDGSMVPLSGDDYQITPTRSWTSPRTGISYPVGWTVKIPSQSLDLTVETLFDDQEMDVSFVYWEGAVTAAGQLGGESVDGVGYVELTGYGESAGDYQR
jgi:predicted secreted hydrolase